MGSKLLIPALLTVLLFVGCDGLTSLMTESEKSVTLDSIVVEPSRIDELQITDSVEFSLSANYSDGTVVDVTDDAAFSVTSIIEIEKGMITAISEGSTTLTISYDGKSIDFPVTTKENYTSLDVSVSSFTGVIGSSYDFIATVTNIDGSSEIISPEDGLEFSDESLFSYYNDTLRIVESGNKTISVIYKSQETLFDLIVDEYTFGERRYIDEDNLLLRAVSYSGYRENQSPETETYPSESEILEDLLLLEKAGFGFLRLYDTSTHAERTLKVISDNNLNFKVMLGVWIYSDSNTSNNDNWTSIDKGIEMALEYSSIISAVSVGNECMVDWNSWNPVDPDKMKQYIQYIRENVTQPVTTDDNWEPVADGLNTSASYPDAILPVMKVVDFFALHTYPIADSPYNIWDWKQDGTFDDNSIYVEEEFRAEAMMDAAIVAAKSQYQAARDALDENDLSDLPIIIGETGWKHTNNSSWEYRPHPVNAAMYYNRMMEWVYGDDRGTTPLDGPMACFYFEAFDEPWKSGDDGWGLFDVEREAYYVLYSQDGSSFEVKEGEDYTEADAVYWPD